MGCQASYGAVPTHSADAKPRFVVESAEEASEGHDEEPPGSAEGHGDEAETAVLYGGSGQGVSMGL